MTELDRLYEDLEKKDDINRINLYKYSFNVQDFLSPAQMEDIAFVNIDKILNIPYVESNKDRFIEYFCLRIDSTKNIYLKSRYAHLLYLLTHKPEWCIKAVSAYKDIISTLSNDSEKAYKCYQIVCCAMTLNSQQKSLIEKEFCPMLLYLFFHGNNKIKFLLLDILKRYNIYTKDQIPQIVVICKDLALSNKDYSLCKRSAEYGIFFANKISKQQKEQIDKLYEILGDNEELKITNVEGQEDNIAIPHMNSYAYIDMIKYYTKGHCDSKRDMAIARYRDNKKNFKYITIHSAVKRDPELVKAIIEYYNKIYSFKSLELFKYLVFGDCLVFLPDKILMNLVKYTKTNVDEYISFKIMKNDINNNQCPISEDKREEWNKFRIFEISLTNQFPYMIGVIINSVKQKTLSYLKLKKSFEKYSCMCCNIEAESTVYSWFDQIDYAIKDFFKQIDNELKGKKTDWRLVVDVLPSKFEGILRDMINLKGGQTTKLKNGETTEMLLDDLLREPTFMKIFDIDDKNLFEYVFTSKGLNIRNNVAHGFYSPQHYDITKAMLVFICIMRLAKFQIS